MERIEVTEDKLLEILNKELSQYPEYKGCSFVATNFKLREPRSDGCNWSGVTVACSGKLGQGCAQFAERIVTEAMKKYNLK